MNDIALKPWPTQPDRYFVSEDGRIFSKTGKQSVMKELKVQTDIKGYRTVNIIINGVQSHQKVHKLVLESWVGYAPIGMQCAHLDGTRDNNHVSNLKWVTPKENAQHKKDHGTHRTGKSRSAMHHWSSKLKPSQVVYMREQYKSGVSVYSLAKKYGLSAQAARDLVIGKTWRYLDDTCKVYSDEDLAARDAIIKTQTAQEIVEMLRADRWAESELKDIIDKFGLEG